MSRRAVIGGVLACLAVAALVFALARDPRSEPSTPESAAAAREKPEGSRESRARAARRESAPGAVVASATPASEPPATDPDEKYLEQAWTVPGRITDVDGRAVPNVTVSVHGMPRALASTHPGEDGGFALELPRIRPGTDVTLRVDADGFVTGLIPWAVPEDGSIEPLKVELRPARAVTGRTVDPEGRPVPGATVSVTFVPPAARAVEHLQCTSAPDGRFTFPARVPRDEVELVVTIPGRPIRKFPLPATTASESAAGDLVCGGGGAVAGTVVETDGTPVPDVPVDLGGLAGGEEHARHTVTDLAGRFDFADVGIGAVDVVVHSVGGAPGARLTYSGSVHRAEVGRSDVRVVVRPIFDVSLRFVDAESGRPLVLKGGSYALLPAGAQAPEELPNSIGGPGARAVWLQVQGRGRYDALVRVDGYEQGEVRGVEIAADADLDVLLRKKP